MQVQGGDEAIGPVRVSGAPAQSLVVSLWNVHDASAAASRPIFTNICKMQAMALATAFTCRAAACWSPNRHPYFSPLHGDRLAEKDANRWTGKNTEVAKITPRTQASGATANWVISLVIRRDGGASSGWRCTGYGRFSCDGRINLASGATLRRQPR